MSASTSYAIPTPIAGSPILVPLDGSTRAEDALPVAERLARTLHAPLLLVRAIPLSPLPYAAAYTPMPPETYQQLVTDELCLATDYVQKQAEQLQQQGLSVQALTPEGDPASALLDVCSTQHVGLIVMTTHGRTGLTRFALGSVADRMVHYSYLPIFLLRSDSTTDTPNGQLAQDVSQAQCTHGQRPSPQLGRAVVPLDGSDLAETALQVVQELAGPLVQQITLLRVMPLTTDEHTRAESVRYLETRARDLRSHLEDRTCTVTILIREGVVPSEKIVLQAEDEGAFVVMATHGRDGVQRWVLGSVADQIVHSAHVPVLLVHPTAVPLVQSTKPLVQSTK